MASVPVQAIVSQGCPRDSLHRCVKMAEPLLRNIDYVFPSVQEDVTTVCRTWNQFVDCVRSYTTSCLVTSDGRQQQLENALGEAVKAVDEMCTNPRYQADYLKHAPCIKSLATDDAKCKKQLGYLVAQVSAFSISNVQICCAHHAFRECMLTATARYCRSTQQLEGSAVQFARDMFSKALGFLLKQCEDYVPSSADCPASPVMLDTWGPSFALQENTRPISNDLSTRRSYPWSQTTYKPWIPGVSNSLDSPKQQGLFSQNIGPRSFGNLVLILSVALTIPYLIF